MTNWIDLAFTVIIIKFSLIYSSFLCQRQKFLRSVLIAHVLDGSPVYRNTYSCQHMPIQYTVCTCMCSLID